MRWETRAVSRPTKPLTPALRSPPGIINAMHRWHSRLLLIAVLLGGRSAAAGDGVPGPEGLVVSASQPASEVGAAVLAAGGNAVDAAVATGFALAVTYPAAGNIGGGGFMIVRQPDGTATSFDFRETAPAAARPEMFLDDAGEIDVGRIESGYLAVGVPGTVRGLALAHARLGRLPWRDLVTPAARLARDGFAVSPTLAAALNRELAGPMRPFPGSLAAYGKPDGSPWQAGDRLVLADLATALEAIATRGPDAFYTGRIAGLLADAMAANGGLITRDDLAAYAATERPPLRGRFFGHGVISMGPPSSGGTALLEMLGMAEALGLERLDPASVEAIHLATEIRRRAYLDRARFLGDPDFVAVPVARLTSRAHAEQLAATIDRERATPSLDLAGDLVRPAPPESAETTHYSIVDGEGMAVATTVTLEASYGSHVVAPGTGFLLNNEMGDFNRKPGHTAVSGDIGTPPNRIAPGKRMLSSMTPTIVTKDGRVVLVTGSPGGRTIINTVFDVVTGVVAHGLDGRAAVDAPRFHHQWLPDRLLVERGGLEADVRRELEARGHTVIERGSQGSAQSIWIDPQSGDPLGIADHRGPDAAAAAAPLPAAVGEPLR
jgi:gamma-glutamyltranspeptidase/glutathione hydrolase